MEIHQVKLSKEQFFQAIDHDINPNDSYYCHKILCQECPFQFECDTIRINDSHEDEYINNLVMEKYRQYQNKRMKLWQNLKI